MAGATLIPWSPPQDLEGPKDPKDQKDPAPPEPPAADCDAVSQDVVTPLIEDAAKTNQLPVKLVRAVIEQESAYRPCAVSGKGAQGLMQLMPETSAALALKEVFSPRENIQAGSKYLRQLLDKYGGDDRLALAAYNAGPAAVDAASGVPDIPETREYVDAILQKIK